MLNIGPPELILIFVIALVIVGPQRLPELGRTIGKGLRELRKMQDEVKDLVNTGIGDDFKETAGELRSATNELKSTAADVKSAADVRSAFRTDQHRTRPHGPRRNDLPDGSGSKAAEPAPMPDLPNGDATPPSDLGSRPVQEGPAGPAPAEPEDAGT